MAILLSDSDVRLLKELKADSEHGCLIAKSSPRAGLMRLLEIMHINSQA